MTDFIEDLKQDILKSMPDVNKQWAEMNAMSILSTLCRNTVVIEKERPMRLNTNMIMIGPSGIKKSLPMTAFTLPIIQGIGERIGRDLLIPSRSSVEGMIKYLGEEDDDGKRKNLDHGIIIRDEFSGLFKELRNKDWQSDGMEFISEMYDGTFQKRTTVGGGTLYVPRFYGTLITCSTPYFISEMDPNFFIQGTGNRFLWGLTTANEYVISDHDSLEYFRETLEKEREDCLAKHIERGTAIYNLDIQKLYMMSGTQDTDDAGRMWLDFKKNCESVWKEKSQEDTNGTGWDYHIIKRYAEFALKLSALYCVSRNFEKWLKHPELISPIQSIDVERAMEFVGQVDDNFTRITAMKRTNIPKDKPKSDEDYIKAFLGYLMQRKDGMATITEWYNSAPIGNPNKKQGWKDYCLEHGMVKEIPYCELTPEQQKRFAKNATVLKYVKGL